MCQRALAVAQHLPVLDVPFLQDRSGLFGHVIATMRGVIPDIISALQTVQANSQCGLPSFIEKPISPFSSTGEWDFAQHLALDTYGANLTATCNAKTTLNRCDRDYRFNHRAIPD